MTSKNKNDTNFIIDRLIKKKCSVLIKIKERNKKLFNFRSDMQALNKADVKRGDFGKVKKRNKKIFIIKTRCHTLNKLAIEQATSLDEEIKKIVDKDRNKRFKLANESL